MNAERIAELRETVLRDVNPLDENDLLAILKDYEAALPLLERVNQAVMYDSDVPGSECLEFGDIDKRNIIAEAIAYRRVIAYRERSQRHD